MALIDVTAHDLDLVCRPDHYLKLIWHVYRTWIAGGDGKLKSKDL